MLQKVDSMQVGYAVCSHSVDRTDLIVSVDRPHQHMTNVVNRQYFLKYLNEVAQVPVIEIQGMYNSVGETSYVIPNVNPDMEAAIANHVFINYEQESYMRLTNHKHGMQKASLVYRNGVMENIGFMREVPEAVAHKLGAWSRRDNKYWACLKNDTSQAKYEEVYFQYILDGNRDVFGITFDEVIRVNVPQGSLLN